MQWRSTARFVGISLLMATAACEGDPGGLENGLPLRQVDPPALADAERPLRNL